MCYSPSVCNSFYFSKSQPCIIPEETKTLPEGVRDVDTDPDPFSVSEYAESIFRNMKRREVSINAMVFFSQ